MEVSFRFAVRTDLGTVRTNNEDSALATGRMLVLADGMGGHAAGEVASTVATRVFAQLAGDDGGADEAGMDERLTLAGRSTRSVLQQMSDADPMLESMGTTLLAVVSHGEQVTVAHIGDSRVYALRGSSLYQVTTDHTHVQRLVDTGQLTPEKARTHPYRAMLLRSLDDQPGGPDLDLIDLETTPGDRLLLCSDGLSDYLRPEEIGELLAVPDPDEAARSLIDAALRSGTRDNVTVVVADVVAADGEADGGGEPGDPRAEVVGAVSEGLELSDPASAALRDRLPLLAALIVRSPDDAVESAADDVDGGAGDAAPHPDRDDDTEADAVADDPDEPHDTAAPERGPADVDEPRDADRPDADPAPDGDDRAARVDPQPAAAPSTARGTAGPQPSEPATESRLPAALAACLLVLVAVAVALIL